MSSYDCARPYGDAGFQDLIIPNAWWRKISPTGDEGGLLCPCCIIRRLHDAGARSVPAAFMSGPLRTVSPELMETMRWVENLREQAGHDTSISGPIAEVPDGE
jgi:hypothetical protein